MDIQLKILTAQDIQDFSSLVDVFSEVFEMKDFTKPGNDYLQTILKKENFLAVVALSVNKVVGGLTAYILHQYYFKRPLAYIYDLAVLQSFQRKGIGQALIKYFTNYCKQKGFQEVFVQADRIDDYALDFYRKTNPTNEEDVVHFYYSL